MVWPRTMGGSKRANVAALQQSSDPARIGVRINRSAIKSGWNQSTQYKDAAPAISQSSLALPMLPSVSGCASTISHAARLQRLVPLSTGGCRDLIIRCGTSAANLTRAGAVASLRSGNRSTQVKSGKTHARLSGSATTRHASVADSIGKSSWTCRSISTTLCRSQLRTSGRNHPTSSYSVRPAINSSTPGGM